MWTGQDGFNAGIADAARLVLSGQATPQQAAELCGVSLMELDGLLAAIPRPRLQQVEETNSYKVHGARYNPRRSSPSNFLMHSPEWEGHTQ